MDQSITLRHANTAQEMTFADHEQAAHFEANIADRDAWQRIGGTEPANEAPHGTVVAVELTELRAAVAADSAEATPAAPAADPAPAKPAKKHK